jgi:segregation and condensation protein A
MRYELSLENYKGPLEKLLELIEARELEITRVNLAEVTGDFLAYLETLKTAGETNPQLVADFLVIASRLILMKSKALLPTLEVSPEEEEEMQDLELRLKIYKQVKLAERHLKGLWSPFPQSGNREFLETSEPLFYPPRSVTPEALARAVAAITGELQRLVRPKAAVRAEIVHLKAKIEEVIARLTDVPRHFADLHGGNRGEIVVLFLAILHLIKEQLIEVDQETQFSEMTVRRSQPDTIVKPGVAA